MILHEVLASPVVLFACAGSVLEVFINHKLNKILFHLSGEAGDVYSNKTTIAAFGAATILGIKALLPGVKELSALFPKVPKAGTEDGAKHSPRVNHELARKDRPCWEIFSILMRRTARTVSSWHLNSSLCSITWPCMAPSKILKWLGY